MTSRVSLLSRLLLAFGAISILAIIEATVVWWNVRSMDHQLMRVTEFLIPQSERIQQLKVVTLRSSIAARQALLARDATSTDRALTDLDRLQADSQSLMDMFSRNLTTEQGRQAFSAVVEAQKAFWTAVEKYKQEMSIGRTEEALAILESQVLPAREKVLAAVDTQQEWQSRLLRDTTATTLQRGEATERLVVIIAVLTLFLGGLLGTVMARDLVRRLGGEPQQAVDAVHAVAQGNLLVNLEIRPHDSSSVMAAVQSMRDRLILLVRQIQEGADLVATAAAQLAAGGDDLSSRTGQQASAVEQASATMHELNESVQASLRKAQSVHTEMKAADKAVGEGVATVKQVVSSMDQTRQRSQRIQDIVGTIDGIAFQTNILALNAAVEAARAGDAGRGFAVVASEVRALAQRSSSAAREVRRLIADSLEGVDAGHQLVSQAGEKMHDIQFRISEVTRLMNELYDASGEQARAVHECASAVRQIDDIAQQNAALVEESSAAASSLRDQAARLTAAVGVFRIGRKSDATFVPDGVLSPRRPVLAVASSATMLTS